MLSCVASSIVILNGDVVTDNPFRFKCSLRSFVRSIVLFIFIFIFDSIGFAGLFVCLFVCLMSVQMKNTLITTTETFIVRLFLINLLCTVVVLVVWFGSFVFSHTHTRMYVHLFSSRYDFIGRAAMCACKCIVVDTLNRQKKNANHIPPVKLTV